MTLELLYLPDCPNHGAAVDMVRDVLAEEGMSPPFIQTPISDDEQAMEHRFPGSPTIRVNGQDIEDVAPDHLAVGLACRTYLVEGAQQTVPPRGWLVRALREARITEERCR